MDRISIYSNNNQSKKKKMGGFLSILSKKQTIEDDLKQLINMTNQIITILKSSQNKEDRNVKNLASSSFKGIPNKNTSQLVFDIKDLQCCNLPENLYNYLWNRIKKNQRKENVLNQNGGFSIKEQEYQLERLHILAKKLWNFENAVQNFRWQIANLKGPNEDLFVKNKGTLDFELKIMQLKQVCILQLIDNSEIASLFKISYQEKANSQIRDQSRYIFDSSNRSFNYTQEKPVKNFDKDFPKQQKWKVEDLTDLTDLTDFLNDLQLIIKGSKNLEQNAKQLRRKLSDRNNKTTSLELNAYSNSESLSSNSAIILSLDNQSVELENQKMWNFNQIKTDNEKKDKQLFDCNQQIQALNLKLQVEKINFFKAQAEKQSISTTLNQRIKEQNDKSDQYHKQIAQNNIIIEQNKTELQRLSNNLSQSEKSVKELKQLNILHQKTLTENNAKIKTYEQLLKQKSDKITQLESNQKLLLSRFFTLKDKYGKIISISIERQQQIEKLEKIKSENEIALDKYKNKVQWLSSQLKTKQLQINNLKNIKIQYQQTIVNLEKKLVELETKVKEFKNQINIISEQSDKKSVQINTLQRKIQELQQTHDSQINNFNILLSQTKNDFQKTLQEKRLLQQENETISHQIRTIQISKCFNGYILGMQSVQDNQWLVTNLQTQLNKRIKNTRMLYKYDKQNPTNFHYYIDNIPNIVLICKLINEQVIVGYSQPPFVYKSEVSNKLGVMFGVKNRKVFNIKAFPTSKTFNQAIPKPISYDNLYINWGNSDFNIKMSNQEAYSSYGTTNCSYEQKEKANPSVFDLLMQKERNINFISYELYEVFFQEDSKNEPKKYQ